MEISYMIHQPVPSYNAAGEAQSDLFRFVQENEHDLSLFEYGQSPRTCRVVDPGAVDFHANPLLVVQNTLQ